MNSDVLLLLLTIVFVLALSFTKTHIAFAILALCGGYILSDFGGEAVIGVFDNWVSPAEFPLNETVLLTMLFLPVLVVVFRFRKTQKGFGRFVQQLVPGLALTMLSIVLIIDVLPGESAEALLGGSHIARLIDDSAALLVLFAIAVAIFDLLTRHAHEPFHHEKKRKRGRPPKKK